MPESATSGLPRHAAWGKRLVKKVTCPNCWLVFAPEELLFVARHPELLNDPVLGSDEYLRFLPVRFTPNGEALDPRGVPSSEMACPRCHLQISEALLEVPPVFVSVIGSPASGKSYFLTTMAWQLRSLMPKAGLAFTDADPVANSPIHEYEQTLFMSGDPDRPTEIRKTQQHDTRLHKTAVIDGVATRFPLPFQFLLWPTSDHPNHASAHLIGRVAVLYDNAGEDFLPGQESPDSAAVQHLARSNILFMVFDPLQEPRLKDLYRCEDPQLAHGLRPGGDRPAVVVRQETLLKEATVRLRRYLGLSQSERLKKPLVVIVAKFDVLEGVAGISLRREPYSGLQGKSPARLKLAEVEGTSEALRGILRHHCPEFVATAESFSEIVRYIPVSSFGRCPELVRRDKQRFYGIRPRDIEPKWVTVPLLYCLSKWGQLILEASVQRH